MYSGDSSTIGDHAKSMGMGGFATRTSDSWILAGAGPIFSFAPSPCVVILAFPSTLDWVACQGAKDCCKAHLTLLMIESEFCVQIEGLNHIEPILKLSIGEWRSP